MAAKYDLTNTLSPYMDRHLVFPLYQFLEVKKLYNADDLLEAKLRLLEKTNMVDSFIDLYKQKTGKTDEEVPAEFVERRNAVLTKLQDLELEIQPMIDFLDNEENLSQFTSDREWNLNFLVENCEGFKPETLEQYYEYAQFQYNCGDYYNSAVSLVHYRIMSTNFSKCLSALWGKFASEIFNQNWKSAFDDLIRLRDTIDQKAPELPPLESLQQRSWLIHWSLFVFFNHEKGRDGIIDMFFQPQFMNTIQTTCPHILRYLATAVITNKRRRHVLPELLRVLQQESYKYSDPITKFVECLFVHYDFEGAQQQLGECEILLRNDFFLVGCREEFIENARLFIFENYCKVHPRISIKMLGERLNLTEDKAEIWIVDLICNARLDAKIDSQEGVVIMGSQGPSIYHQVIEKTSRLSNRTNDLANLLQKRANNQNSDFGV